MYDTDNRWRPYSGYEPSMPPENEGPPPLTPEPVVEPVPPAGSASNGTPLAVDAPDDTLRERMAAATATATATGLTGPVSAPVAEPVSEETIEAADGEE